MADLLLLETDVVVADACHRVLAPGGYEWWYFDAQDTEKQIGIVAVFYAGLAFHPEYLRRLHLYLRRPTRHAPPSPAEYPGIHLAIYEKGRWIAGFTQRYAAAQFQASSSECQVTIGPNRISPIGSALQLEIKGSTGLSADLKFEPCLAHPPVEKGFLRGNAGRVDRHYWVIANPLCEVRGEIRLSTGRTIRLDGLGYHDHRYGTGPIGSGVRRWLCGRVLQDNQAVTFQITTPIQPDQVDEAHIFKADHSAAGAIAAPRITWGSDRFTAWGLSYPTAVDIGRTLILRQPRLLDCSPFCMRLMYDAFVDGESASALCQIVYPHRLTWPILGRWIEKSITTDHSRE